MIAFESIGLEWQGEKYNDIFCLGAGDVHTTVCMEDFPFIVTSSQINSNKAQWDPPLRDYEDGNVNTIVGLGFDSSVDPDNSFNFLQQAYEAGYIANNTYTFQGVQSNSEDVNA